MNDIPKPTTGIVALLDRIPKKAALGATGIIALAWKPVSLDIAICITIIAVIGTLAQCWIDHKSIEPIK